MKRPALRYFQPLKLYRELDILPLLFDFRAEHEPDDDTLCDAIAYFKSVIDGGNEEA